MRWLGGTAPEGRDGLPDGMAPAGAAWDGVRMRFSCALMGAMAVGCVPWDGVRGRGRRLHSHQDGGRMRSVGMAPAGVPRAGLSKQWMRFLRWRSDARFAHDHDRAASITGLNHTLIFHRMGYSCPPNVLRISRAAYIDRDGVLDTVSIQNRADLVAGTASGCMRWLGGTTPEARADLPAMLAFAGGA